jgi:hypothetical protein
MSKCGFCEYVTSKKTLEIIKKIVRCMYLKNYSFTPASRTEVMSRDVER